MSFISTYSKKRNRVGRSFKIIKDSDGNSLNTDFVYHRTKQSFKDECDINRIVDRYPDVNSEAYRNQVAGLLNANPGLFGEYDSAMDYGKAISIVERAHEQFDTLPATLRERFAQDPFQFLSYVNDSSNREEALKLGLLREDIPLTNIPQTPSAPVIQPSNTSETQSS